MLPPKEFPALLRFSLHLSAALAQAPLSALHLGWPWPLALPLGPEFPSFTHLMCYTKVTFVRRRSIVVIQLLKYLMSILLLTSVIAKCLDGILHYK